MHDLTDGQRELITEQLRLREAARALVPDARVPYFAHMRVATAGRQRDLLLGPATKAGDGVSIIDWQKAPLAEAFFAVQEGEEYEFETAERTLSGTLLRRTLVTFERGELIEIVAGNDVLSRRGDADWHRLDAEAELVTLRAPEVRGRRVSPIEVVLDEAQRRVVELPASRSVLVLGEAGYGKTTVILHRLAYLERNATGDFSAAVIVPTEGLRRLVVALLERLETSRIEVWLYDRWAGAEARRVFPKLPERESEDATAGVLRIKRHPALRPTLVEYVRRRPRRRMSSPLATRNDLLHLFGDSVIVGKAGEATAATTTMTKEVLEHTRVQFHATTEQEYAGADAERLQAVDSRAIDAGTPMGDADTIDAEDYAILFELDRLRAGNRGIAPVELRTFDCVVVDEAQELAPIELQLIGRARAPGGSVLVAGDAAQQVDPTANFSGWEQTMAELGAQDFEGTRLEVSYRCPPEVTALARYVLDPTDPRASVVTTAQLARRCHESDFHLAAALVTELQNLFAHDLAATVAVITRTPEGARRWARHLARGLDVRLVLGGDFEFSAGVNVTHVQESKGLEFDYVILPDVSLQAYPDTPEARRALYVAVTRATHELILATVGDWSPLLGAGTG